MIPVKKTWQQEKNIVQKDEIAEVEPVDKRVYTIVKLLIIIILYYVVIFM